MTLACRTIVAPTEMTHDERGVLAALRRAGRGAFAAAGAAGFVAAEQIMRLANRRRAATQLDARTVAALRPEFGAALDEVAWVFEARMLEELVPRALFPRRGATLGMTFGGRIYLREPFRPGDARQLELLAHELIHHRQFREAGGSLARFGFRYFAGFACGGYRYRTNPLETEAYARAAEFASARRRA